MALDALHTVPQALVPLYTGAQPWSSPLYRSPALLHMFNLELIVQGLPPIPDMFKFVEIEPHCTETIHHTCDMLKLVQYVACTARKPASWHSTKMPSCLKQTAANAIRSVSLQ